MARRTQTKKNWLRGIVFFIGFPLIVWFAAFLMWFYWHDLSRWFADEPPRRTAPKAARARENEQRREGASAERPKSERSQEKILEEERRKLEDILKRRN
jgi:hypothetical protein